MPQIELLNQQTIDKIAAGEVVERPSSVVKELVENAIDAGASAVTVEIKEGGISFIRITDNGCGIEPKQVPTAFLRHSTSKIRSVEDLMTVSSLGFRGEALSSIAAVSQVELITKTSSGISGKRYVIEGGEEKASEEIGAPEGTTFLVRNLFYNTPVRRKFLKTPATEAGYINDLMERLALSHPEISFKFIANNQVRLHTSGNSNLKEIIYHIYGRDIAANLLPFRLETELFSADGFIGKPLISRGNRNFENYFINGRYVKSALIAKSIEDGYKSFVMQHKYPFTAFQISINGESLDVNVHPAKMELRFRNQEQIYESISGAVRETINRSELIYQVELEKEPEQKAGQKKHRDSALKIPEPFEKKRWEALKVAVRKDSPYEEKYKRSFGAEEKAVGKTTETAVGDSLDNGAGPAWNGTLENTAGPAWNGTAGRGAADKKTEPGIYQQASMEDMLLKEDTPGYEKKLLAPESRKYHKIIGQIFETYWLVQFEEKLYIIDQHAAHEKVLYERILSSLAAKELTSQSIFPPILISLTMQEEELLKKYLAYFETLGFVIEPFGGREYSVTSVPANLFGLNGKDLMVEIIDGFTQFHGNETPQIVIEKIASMSCKAAVKGNQRISRAEAERLIDELLMLENPYHCPHGRPTIISMSKYELEKKFKRVL